MSDDLQRASHVASGEAPPFLQPVRLASLALVVLGAFEVGRLVAAAVVGPWLAQVLLGTRAPVIVGEVDLSRLAIEVLAIALGVGLSALIALPLVKVIGRR